MISYQCSPLATPSGIVTTFQQCAKLQQDKNLYEFVSVVVLDEVGLAEDSPRMPLKVIMIHHPIMICHYTTNSKYIFHFKEYLINQQTNISMFHVKEH